MSAVGRTSPSRRPSRPERLRFWREVSAEFVGTASLLAAIVGSGIVTSQDGSLSAQLFQHAVIVGAALTALILTFGPVSGAHFNPAVTIADAWFGGRTWAQASAYVVAQLAGGVAGTIVTNATFGLAPVQLATLERGGAGMVVGELLATSGLLVVIFGLVRSGGGRAVAPAVGTFIGAAIYFTSSTAFANPAVTVARLLSDTYTGIAPASVPGFLAGQLLGLVAAVLLVIWWFEPTRDEAQRVIVPRAAPREPLPERTPDG